MLISLSPRSYNIQIHDSVIRSNENPSSMQNFMRRHPSAQPRGATSPCYFFRAALYADMIGFLRKFDRKPRFYEPDYEGEPILR